MITYSSLEKFTALVQLKDFRGPTKKEYVRYVRRLGDRYQCARATLNGTSDSKRLLEQLAVLRVPDSKVKETALFEAPVYLAKAAIARSSPSSSVTKLKIGLFSLKSK